MPVRAGILVIGGCKRIGRRQPRRSSVKALFRGHCPVAIGKDAPWYGTSLNLHSAIIRRIRQGAGLALVGLAAAGELNTQAQQSIFAVGKAGQYVQTAPGTPGFDPTAAYVATAAAPSSGSVVTPNGATRGLTYMATGGTVFANNGDYESDQYFMSQSQLDSSFPSGTYQFLRPGRAIHGQLLPERGPPIPPFPW